MIPYSSVSGTWSLKLYSSCAHIECSWASSRLKRPVSMTSPSSTSENAKYGFLKIFNNYIFIIFIILIIYIFYNPKLPKRKKDTLNFNKRFILTVSIISTVILFYKFPLGRYGTSYFIILTYFLFYFLFKNKIKILDQKKIKKTFTYLVVFTGLIFLSKNVSKIALNFDVSWILLFYLKKVRIFCYFLSAGWVDFR